MSIIRTDSHILLELIVLLNSVITFLSQMTLLRWLTFLLRPLTVTLTVLLFWIYLFLLMLVFFLHWLSLHWEIVIMWLSQFPSTSCQTQNEMHCFITQLMFILRLMGMVFVIICEMLHGRISLNSQLLLLLMLSGKTSLTSMSFSCLCCRHSSQKSLFLFVPTEYIF